ncbi:hypothetical protein ACMFMG_004611 [Clarireedia jacksonii]
MLHNSKDEENSEEESHPLVERVSNSTRIKSLRQLSPQQPNIWIFTTFVLAFLLLAIGVRDYVQSKRIISQQQCGYETGFDTEWTPAREAIGLKKVKFYGGIRFDDNEKQYYTTNPDEPVYVGPPTPEMDDAWYALTHNESIAVTREEAKAVSDRSAYDKQSLIKNWTTALES